MPKRGALLGLSLTQLAAISAAFFIPRLFLLNVSYGASFDMQSYFMVDDSLHRGLGLYANPALDGRYPYLPAWAGLLWCFGWLARTGLMRPWIAFKLPGLLAELGIVFFILKHFQNESAPGKRGFWAAMGYALNPLSWLVTACHGQFDAVVLFLILGAASALRARRALGAGAFFGIAVAFKSWPLFLLPLFFWGAEGKAARLRLLSLALGIPLLLAVGAALFWGAASLAGHLAYAGLSEVSISEFLELFGELCLAPARAAQPFLLWKAAAWACLLIYWGEAWRFRPRQPLTAGLAEALLVLLIFAPMPSAHYLLWPLPFLLLGPPRRAWAYSAAAALLLLAFYLLFCPEALNKAWPPGQYPMGPGLKAAWAGLNLGFWLFLVALAFRKLRNPLKP